MAPTAEWCWSTATNPHVIHALICACDQFVATSDQPAPTRRMETSIRRVLDGCVQLLLVDAQPAATFTLSRDPPYSLSLEVFPSARMPLYLGRLAVHPTWLAKGSLMGVHALRRAVDLATDAGADVLRSEANPTLGRMRTVLEAFGFREHGASEASDGRRRIYLQKDLAR
jgi:hypothetical protein